MATSHSALDATRSFKHNDMRWLWKKKFGADKTKVKITEFCDMFISHAEKDLKKYRANYWVKERINRARFPPEIALRRYINALFNSNMDDELTVYELSQTLLDIVSPAKKSVDYTTKFIVDREEELLRSLKFKVSPVPKTDIHFKNYVPYRVVNDLLVHVRPFHRVLINVEHYLMHEDFYEFDHLVLLEHSCDPRALIQKSYTEEVEFLLTEAKYSKCYVRGSTNELVTSRCDKQWNAYKTFRYQTDEDEYEKFTPAGFAGVYNWEAVPVEPAKMPKKAKEDNEIKTIQHVHSLTRVSRQRILYCPYMLCPGVYSPRYCLDSYESSQPNQKLMAKSLRSYYAGNIDVLQTESSPENTSKAKQSRRASTRRGSVRRTSVTGRRASKIEKVAVGSADNGEDLVPKEFTVKRESVGLILECLDELEIVWAENEKWDIWPYDEDDEHDGEEEEESTKRQYNWRPQLHYSYPYLPDRKLILSEPELVGVFINVPDRKSSLRLHVDEGAHNNDNLLWGDIKVGVFFEKTGELISDVVGSSFWVNKHDPLHKIRLQDIFQKDEKLEKEALGERSDPVIGDDGSLDLVVAFIKDGKPVLDAPFLSLSIQDGYDSEDEDSYSSGEDEDIFEFEEDEFDFSSSSSSESGSSSESSSESGSESDD